jgi:putative hydrolase of the HAD superfamily
MKKIISFDLDGTIVNACYGDMVWNHGIPVEYSKIHSVPFDEAKALIRRQYESVGDCDLLWYEIDYWLERFSIPVSSKELLRRYESYIEPVLYAADVLEHLSKKYTIVIASNAARCFVEKELDHTGFRRYFTYVVSATTDYRMIKKEQEFYRKMCAYMQVQPSEVVHVGDHPVFDHDIPSSLGIESYYLTDTEDDKANIDGRQVIKSLRDLSERL